MTDQPESFEEWRERTAVPVVVTRLAKVGSFIAACLLVANMTGFAPLWILAVPALVVWTVVDWRRTRRRRQGA